jgi:hypothetical protein
MEHVIHERLEGGGSIGETKHNEQNFDVAMVRLECRLGHIIWVHQHLVVAAMKAELGEVARPFELIQELINDWDWKLVFHGLSVEGTVVDAESPNMIFLADEQDRCGEW